MRRTLRRAASPDTEGSLERRNTPSELPPSLWLAVVLCLTSVVLAVWAIPAEPTAVAWVAFSVVGVVLVWLRPAHPVGWLLIVDGLLWTGGGAVYRHIGAVATAGTGEAAIAALYDLALSLVAVGLIPLILLLVPNGRLDGRADRVAGLAIAGGGFLHVTLALIFTGPLPSDPSIANPFQIATPPSWVDTVADLSLVVFFLGVIGALIALVFRFTASTGVVRQQLRWLAFAGAMMLAGFAVGGLLDASGLPGQPWANTIPTLLAPVGIGLATVRYRLWDLDIVVRTALGYGLIAVVVTGIYFLVVVGVGALAERAGAATWLTLFATALAATLFQPLRGGAIATVNRMFAPKSSARPELMVRTLGGFRVERAGVPVPGSEWRSRKARQLLKMLVAKRGRPLHRDEVIEFLWPDSEGGNLSNRLAVALSTLRSVLDPEKAHQTEHYVESGDETLFLRLDRVSVDLESFLEAATSASSVSQLKEAEALYRGDFLIEDLYEDWARAPREEARSVFLDVLRRRVGASDQVDPAASIEARLKILEIDPWDEASHLGLIRDLESAGHHGEARRARRRYESAMSEIDAPAHD